MDAETRSLVEELKSTFDKAIQVNEAKLEAIRQDRGHAEFDAKLEKMTQVMNDLEAKQQKWARDRAAEDEKRRVQIAEEKAALEERERLNESRVNRLMLKIAGGSTGNDPDGEALVSGIRRKAYNHWLRWGESKGAHMGLSSNELELLPKVDGEVKVMTVGNDTTGGYLAPPAFLTEISKAAVLYSPMRDMVTVRPISTGSLQQPRRTQTASATWVSEIGTRSETPNPNYGLVTIPAHEMTAEARVSTANLEDSAFDLEAELALEFGEQFGVTEGAAVVSGTGVGKPLGFLDTTAGLSFTMSGGATTIKGASGAEADGLVNLFHAVKGAYAINGRWVFNRASLGKIRLLKDTTGQYIWAVGLPGAPNTILGAPYTEVPDMPDEGSGTFPVAFGDFRRMYTLVDRIGMSIIRDPYSLSASGQVKFTARRRMGGWVMLAEAVRLLKCST